MNLFTPYDLESYPASGIFSAGHFLLLIVVIILIVGGLLLTKKWQEKEIIHFSKIMTIVITILELIKIGYNFCYHYFALDNWLPLSFCALFIYALYMVSFGSKRIYTLGCSYIVGAGLICGSFFLIFPSTSLTLHPWFHYLSIYSMFYHGLMLFMSLLYLGHQLYIPTFKNYLKYLLYCVPFCVAAVIVNIIWDANLMFLMDPYNIPLGFLKTLKNNWQLGYTVLIILSYSLTYFAAMILYYIRGKKCTLK